MVEELELKTLAALEKAVVDEILRCEPHPALKAQWKEAKVKKREFFPHAIFTFFLIPSVTPAPKAAKLHTLGGYTYARLAGKQGKAAFTLHTDQQGRLSHLTSFMDDDSAWPSRVTEFEVFSVKREASPTPPAPEQA